MGRGKRRGIEPERCAGYLRKPHKAPIVLELQHPDGTKEGLCHICATRWLLSDEEWPPTKTIREGNSPT